MTAIEQALKILTETETAFVAAQLFEIDNLHPLYAWGFDSGLFADARAYVENPEKAEKEHESYATTSDSQ